MRWIIIVGSMGVVSFSIIFFLSHFIREKKQQLKKEENRAGLLDWFKPGVRYIVKCHKKRIVDLFSRKRLECLQRIYVGKGKEELVELYAVQLGSIVALFVIIIFLLLSMTIWMRGGGSLLYQGNRISRNAPEGNAKVVHLEAEAAGDKQSMDLVVNPQGYTAEQREAKFSEAKRYVQKHYLGENVSADKVKKTLSLVSAIPNSAVLVEWQLDSNHFIQSDGTIAQDKLDEKTSVEIMAILSYGEESERIPFELTLVPPEKSNTERLWEAWKQEQKQLDAETEEEAYLQLPNKVNSIPVSYRKSESTSWYIVVLIGILGIPVLVFGFDSRLRQMVDAREKELRMDYPEMLEQFVLLVGAGLTVKGAWLRITSDYCSKQKQDGKRYVYEEMLVTVREMENGMSETRAYEMFGKRIGILPYMKFSTLLVQNLRKGSADLLRILEYEAVDAFRVRKEQAKTLGEEAGTKLLLPMMFMLLIVFVMILYAAFRSM